MIDTKLNLKLITQIKQDEAILTGKKTVDVYINDPSFYSQLSSDDKDHLYSFQESVNNSLKLDKEVEKQGIDINSIRVRGVPDYFRLTPEEYKKIIPVFIKWIQDKKENKWEGIIRTLSIPSAKPYVLSLFLNEFLSTSDKTDHSYKWAIGNGLEVFASDDIIDDLIPLVVDKKNGKARQLIVLGLGKMKKEENKEKATNVLLSLLDDEEVAGHAIAALGKLKAEKAKPYIEKFLTSKNTFWRNEAKTAIRKIDKSQEKIK